MKRNKERGNVITPLDGGKALLARKWMNRDNAIQSSKESQVRIQCSCSGWPTGYGKKRSSSQAQLGQATCFAVA